jgi:hypothetical protein
MSDRYVPKQWTENELAELEIAKQKLIDFCDERGLVSIKDAALTERERSLLASWFVENCS